MGNIPATSPYIPEGQPNQPPPKKGPEFPKGTANIDVSGYLWEKYVLVSYTQYWV